MYVGRQRARAQAAPKESNESRLASRTQSNSSLINSYTRPKAAGGGEAPVRKTSSKMPFTITLISLYLGVRDATLTCNWHATTGFFFLFFLHLLPLDQP